MNKKNNLGKISIPFSLLSIFLVSCGKNTPTIETTHQNLKTTFSLNVTPSANYIAQPDTQTIVIPESGCVILNSSVSTNNNKKDLSFNNINLQSNVLEHFQLDNKTQTLCHLGILQPNEPDTAELVLNSDNESSETYKIEVAKHNLPTLSLNSFEQNNSFKVFNFSFEINNKKHPLNPKLYNIKFLSQDGNTIAFVPENSIKVLDYNNNNIGTIQKLNDGSTQISLINDFNLKIDSIVIGHKNSITANKYIIRDNNKTIHYMLSGSFFANEISTRESLFNDKFDSLTKTFQEKVELLADDIVEHFSEVTNKFSALKEELTQLINNKFQDLSGKFKEFNRILIELNQYVRKEIASFKTTLQEANNKIKALRQQVLDLNIEDNRINQSIENLKEDMNVINLLATQNQRDINNLKIETIADLSNRIRELETIINGDGTPEKPGLIKLSESIPALNSSINLFSTDISTLKNKVTELAVFKIKYAATSLTLFKEKQGIEALIAKLNEITKDNIKEKLTLILADLNTITNNSPSDLDTPQLDVVNAIKASFTELNAIINPIPKT
jgi:uncharacterized coiled-coil DUF342 family protein